MVLLALLVSRVERVTPETAERLDVLVIKVQLAQPEHLACPVDQVLLVLAVSLENADQLDLRVKADHVDLPVLWVLRVFLVSRVTRATMASMVDQANLVPEAFLALKD